MFRIFGSSKPNEHVKTLNSSGTVVDCYYYSFKELVIFVFEKSLKCADHRNLVKKWEVKGEKNILHKCSSFQEDYGILLTGDDDGFVRMYDIKNEGKLMKNIIPKKEEENIFSTLSMKRKPKAFFQDLRRKQELRKLEESKTMNPIFLLSFISSRNKVLFVREGDSFVSSYGFHSCQLEYEYGKLPENPHPLITNHPPTAAITCMTCKGDIFLTVGYDDGYIRQFEISTGKMILFIDPPSSSLFSSSSRILFLEYLPFSEYIVFCRQQQQQQQQQRNDPNQFSKTRTTRTTLKLWDIEEQKQKKFQRDFFCSVLFYEETQKMLFCFSNQTKEFKIYKTIHHHPFFSSSSSSSNNNNIHHHQQQQQQQYRNQKKNH